MIHLAASSAADGPSGGNVMIILMAIGILFFTARLMARAVGPFREILRAAMAAVTSFALITAVVGLLLFALLRQ